MQKYRCKNCGYIYNEEIENISSCLLCGGKKTNIELWNDAEGFLKKEREKKRKLVSDLNPSIARIDELCIDCGLCERVCSNVLDYPLSKQNVDNPICINCGQCVMNCPTKALVPKYNYKQVLNYLNDTEYIVTVSVAPAVRVAIGDFFGYKPGEFLEKKLVSALRRLNFSKVFDLTFGADVTIMEEASELLKRLKEHRNLPQFTSCCPSWVKYCEIFHDELIPNLSTTKSPISIQGMLINTYYTEFNNLDKEKVINVMVAPCTAKKYEIKRNELIGMDYVITTEELIMMLKECNIDFKNLKEEEFDYLLSRGSSSGVIFGTSGGVMEAALRTAYYLYTKEKAPAAFYELQELRGEQGIKEATITMKDLTFKVAVVNEMKNLNAILPRKEEYAFIEVMNCPGGCIGGGGQPLIPISKLKEYREQRTLSLYNDDKNSNFKDCYENQEVIELYKTFLEYPLSPKAHTLLHTSYKSKKEYFKTQKKDSN